MDAIYTDCSVIYEFIKNNLQSQTISELTDIRKIQELIHESNSNKNALKENDAVVREVSLPKKDWDKAAAQFGAWGVLFSLLQIIGSFHGNVTKWVVCVQVVILILLALYWFRSSVGLFFKNVFSKLTYCFGKESLIDNQIINMGSSSVDSICQVGNFIENRVIYDFSSLRIKAIVPMGFVYDIGEFVEKDFVNYLGNNFPRQDDFKSLAVIKISERNEETKMGSLRKKYSIWISRNGR